MSVYVFLLFCLSGCYYFSLSFSLSACSSLCILFFFLSLSQSVLGQILANSESTVVKHLPHHPKVTGSSPAVAAGTALIKCQKYVHYKNHSPKNGSLQTIFKIHMLVQILANSDSTVVEHLPHHPKVMDSSPAVAAGTALIKCQKYVDYKNIHLIVGHYKQYSKYISWYKYWQAVKAQW